MPRKRRHFRIGRNGKKIAQNTLQGLVLFGYFLLAIIFVLMFEVGESVWPAWLIEYRTRIAGILLFALTFLIFLSPVIVEVNSHPRALSGPGRNPWKGWDP